MRPFAKALIWGVANATFYAWGASTSYGNSIPRDAPERSVYAVVTFATVLAASTLAAWYMMRARQRAPASAWRWGGAAAGVAAAIVFIPIHYWITVNAYAWYLRLDPGATDYTLTTFLGGLLGLPILFAAVFLPVLALSEGVRWLGRHRGPLAA